MGGWVFGMILEHVTPETNMTKLSWNLTINCTIQPAMFDT